MTYLEAIKAEIKPYEVGEITIMWQCKKVGIAHTDEMFDISKVTIVSIKLLSQMLSLNNVSEGGVSQSFNEKQVQKHIQMLCAEIGEDSTKYIYKPTVTLLGEDYVEY